MVRTRGKQKRPPYTRSKIQNGKHECIKRSTEHRVSILFTRNSSLFFFFFFFFQLLVIHARISSNICKVSLPENLLLIILITPSSSSRSLSVILKSSSPFLRQRRLHHRHATSMAAIGHSNLNAKLVLLGDMGAGKSSLVLRFVKGQFHEFQESTIGAAFFSQTLAVNDATVKFEIWDTAGQERYHSLAPMYYRGAAAAIIVYDITTSESFTRAKKWVQELQKQGNPNMVMALAGNKADLEDKRSVTSEEARTYAEENGLFFMETSAKTAANVNDIFYEIARRLPRAQPAQNPAGIVLANGPAEGARAASCCT